jgi:nitrate reductase gamma subunit
MSVRDLYVLASGPLLWAALAVLVAGSLWQVTRLVVLGRGRDEAVYRGFRPVWALVSLLRWLVPINVTTRENPMVIVLFLVFHLTLLGTAVLLPAHVVLLRSSWGAGWWSLPTSLADMGVVVFLVCAAFFALRRVAVPEVRALTTRDDWISLGLTVAPPLTGFFAYHQIGDYELVLTLHVLSGDLLLAAIPFTKLSHAYLFFLSRAVTGSDFGKRGVGAW